MVPLVISITKCGAQLESNFLITEAPYLVLIGLITLLLKQKTSVKLHHLVSEEWRRDDIICLEVGAHD